MKNTFIITMLILFPFFGVGQSIEKFSIDSGGASVSAGGIQILYTIGEVNVAEYSTATLSVSEGFINSTKLQIKINPAVFLQGPYSAGLMLDNLRNNGLIPTTSTYTDALSCNSSVFTTTGTNAIIDWVWMEIRDTDALTVITSRSALLQADGDVVDVNGTSAVNIDAPSGSYYFMISHRNHLGIITANTLSLVSGATTAIDLTQNIALINGGTNAIATMGDGNLALYAGDFNGDGQVQNTDKSAVEPLRGTNGYTNADIDMNSEVQNTDINNKLNPNIGKGIQYTAKKLHAKRKNQ